MGHGDDVPDDGAEEAAANDVDINGLGIDKLVRDSLSDTGTEEESGDEIEERGPEDSLQRGEDPGGDYGSDGVGRVVETVEEVEDKRDANQDEDKVEDGHRPSIRS